MGLTEKHLFEDEDPEAATIDIPGTTTIDIPGTTTIKIKRRIPISATRCIACGTWECPDFDHELYEAVITGETAGLCESCRKAVLWTKGHMNDSD